MSAINNVFDRQRPPRSWPTLDDVPWHVGGDKGQDVVVHGNGTRVRLVDGFAVRDDGSRIPLDAYGPWHEVLA